MPPLLPAQFEVFAAEVVPLLQRRGLFRTEYNGTTFREHYGLDLARQRLRYSRRSEASPGLNPTMNDS
jgi:hypothetical protein